MKRILVALCLFAFLVGSLSAEESAFYPLRVNVVKVYSHADGFRVVYQKGQSSVAEAYIPIKWFSAGGKAELVRGESSSYPYMVVFYKEGKFSHLRLYISSDIRNPSWGILSPDAGKGKFDAEDLKLEF